MNNPFLIFHSVNLQQSSHIVWIRTVSGPHTQPDNPNPNLCICQASVSILQAPHQKTFRAPQHDKNHITELRRPQHPSPINPSQPRPPPHTLLHLTTHHLTQPHTTINPPPQCPPPSPPSSPPPSSPTSTPPSPSRLPSAPTPAPPLLSAP